jgi:hypothetical protein
MWISPRLLQVGAAPWLCLTTKRWLIRFTKARCSGILTTVTAPMKGGSRQAKSEEGLGPALMMRLLLDLSLDRGYFRPLADHPTIAQALWTAVHELRMAGVRSKALKPEMFSSLTKHAELVALLSAYERFLDQHRRGDIARRV